MRFEGWKGSFVDSYFNNLENGEWVKISFLKYIWLKIKGFRVRIVKSNNYEASQEIEHFLSEN